MKGKPLLTIFFVVFLDLVGFGIIIPILPYYSRAFGATAFELGWLMASFSIAQFLFAPFWGSLSDHYGRRPILIATIGGITIATLATAYANSLLFLFIARSLAGVFGANISTASAYIADVTKPEDRAKGMGIIGAGFGLGFIFGPAIGGILSPYGYEVPLLFAAGLSIINMVFAYFRLEEAPISEEKRELNRRRVNLGLAKLALAKRSTALPILCFFFVTFAFTQLEVAFALYVLHTFHYTAKEAGILLAIMGLVMVAMQGGMIGRLSKRFGEPVLVVFGLALMASALLVAGLATQVAVFIASLVAIALANGLINPSLSSLLSKASRHDERGATMGIYQSAGSLARIFGPPVSGFFFEHISKASPIFLSSAVMALTLLLAKELWKENAELS